MACAAAVAGAGLVLSENTHVLWPFDDDYASCDELCTQRARYRKVGDTAWTWLTAGADPTGMSYAYAELPAGSLEAGTYQFRFEVLDCAGQKATTGKFYYFTVPMPQ